MSDTLNVMMVVELDIHPDWPVQKCLIHRKAEGYVSGMVLGAGDLEVSADLEESEIVIRLNSAMPRLVEAILDRKYRNRRQVIRLLWVGDDDDAFDIANPKEARQFWYFADSHYFEEDGTLGLRCKNIWARYEQTTNARTNHAEQTALIARGLVGDGTPDRAFERAGVDFSNVGLGERKEIVQKKKTGMWPARKTQRIVIPGQEATPLNDDGSQYKRDLAIGGCRMRGNLISAWNTRPLGVIPVSFYAGIGVPHGWANSYVPAGTTDETKWVMAVYAVAEGILFDVRVHYAGMQKTGNEDPPVATTKVFTDDSIIQIINETEHWRSLMRNRTYESLPVSESNYGIISACAVRVGKKVNRQFLSPVGTDTPLVTNADNTDVWSDNHLAHGVAIVAVASIAAEEWPGGVPDIQFFTERGMRLPDMTAAGVVVESTITSDEDGANPANVILALLHSKIYGYGIDPNLIDYDAFVAARDTGAKWRGAAHDIKVQGLIFGDLTLRERLIQVLEAGSMMLIHGRDGKMKLRTRGYPDAEGRRQIAENLFTPRNRGPITNHEGADTSEVYNHAIVRAPVANQSNETDDFETMIVDNTAFQQDGFQVSTATLDYPLAAVRLDTEGHPYPADIEHLVKLGRAAIDRSRLNQRGSFQAALSQQRVWRLEPGDIIAIQDDLRFGDRTILARVVRMVFHPPGLVDIDWVEYSPLIYDLNRRVSEYHAYALQPA